MKKLLWVGLFALVACTDPDRAVEILQAQGYREIETTGYAAFSCSDDDTYKTGFVATSPSGQRVEGTVCCGAVMKGCTVRIDRVRP